MGLGCKHSIISISLSKSKSKSLSNTHQNSISAQTKAEPTKKVYILRFIMLSSARQGIKSPSGKQSIFMLSRNLQLSTKQAVEGLGGGSLGGPEVMKGR